MIRFPVFLKYMVNINARTMKFEFIYVYSRKVFNMRPKAKKTAELLGNEFPWLVHCMHASSLKGFLDYIYI